MGKKISSKLFAELEHIVGVHNIIKEREKMLDYSHDEFSLKEISRMPDMVVKPSSAVETSSILKLACRENIPVTPRGGATGLCGGCVPQYGGIVLSLENMNRIKEIDKDSQMAVVEAGVTLMEFSRAVEDEGLYFPPHPGDESAFIGGLIATNAGGSRAVKYGVIRHYICGLEVVLPTGKIIRLGGKLIKSSTGYSLLNLMIGSEGTLGVITEAVIRLLPFPGAIRTLIIPYHGLEEAIETVPLLLKKNILPMAVEFIPREVIQVTEDYLQKKWPCAEGETHLAVILDARGTDELDFLSEEVAEICFEKGALDVFVADSPQKQRDVLEIRSKIYEAIKTYTVEILDIVVPRGEIAVHVKKVQEVSEKYGIWLPTFGHAADGNVHTHIMKGRYVDGKIIPVPENTWRPKIDQVREELYRDCRLRGGMISGEHGIGLVKQPFIDLVLDEETLSLMRGIKDVFDPDRILNPGKIFPMNKEI
ncbi:MAG: FAD-binding oxidoreductase [Candidatus Aminicenantes bacterium]|nr:FAD-binding oxidoreductase [Candidatus Aminicenantes bacterium]